MITSFKKIAFITSCIEGSLVIIIELLGTKMMTPLLGNSLKIWTNTLGITLLFLTFGYFFGGKLKQKLSSDLISNIIGLASLFILMMPIVAIPIIESTINQGFLFSSIISSIFIIGIPIFVVSSISPILIQLLSDNLDNSGKHAGFVFALSTVGGIIFSFLIGLYILPTFGITKPLLFFSCLLVIYSLLLKYTKYSKYIIMIFIFLLAKNIHNLNIRSEGNNNVKVKYLSESLLGQVKIVDAFQPNTKLSYRTLFLNGINQTNIINNSEVVSIWDYVHKISMVSSFKRNGEALLLGMGAGSIATEMNKLNIKTDLVDIDDRMYKLAKDYFYYNDSISRFYNDDARHFLNTTTKKYDLIIIDLLSGESQPTNIFTLEGISKIKKTLKPNGICVFEFQEKRGKKGISAFQSICNTFIESGLNVQYNKNQSEIIDYIIVASINDINLKIDFNDVNQIKQLSSSYKHLGPVAENLKIPYIKLNKKFKNGIIFTDNKPLLETINYETISNWRRFSIFSFGLNELKETKKLFE